MSDLPPLAILLLTYKRTYEALATISSTIEHLQYPRELIKWYIADDGSESEHFMALESVLQKNGQVLLGWHSEKFSAIPYACGKGWNQGLGLCHQTSDFVLVLEDDWVMESDLEPVPYIKLLQDREDVGIVSFRILSIGADVHTVGHDGRIYLEYLRTTQYAYSGNPHIRHARYTKYYGWYAEDRSPGLIELDQDDRYRLDVSGGSKIWRQANLDPWGGWHHIGTEKTWR
jgi:hypothetical protein